MVSEPKKKNDGLDGNELLKAHVLSIDNKPAQFPLQKLPR